MLSGLQQSLASQLQRFVAQRLSAADERRGLALEFGLDSLAAAENRLDWSKIPAWERPAVHVPPDGTSLEGAEARSDGHHLQEGPGSTSTLEEEALKDPAVLDAEALERALAPEGVAVAGRPQLRNLGLWRPVEVESQSGSRQAPGRKRSLRVRDPSYREACTALADELWRESEANLVGGAPQAAESDDPVQVDLVVCPGCGSGAELLRYRELWLEQQFAADSAGLTADGGGMDGTRRPLASPPVRRHLHIVGVDPSAGAVDAFNRARLQALSRDSRSARMRAEEFKGTAVTSRSRLSWDVRMAPACSVLDFIVGGPRTTLATATSSPSSSATSAGSVFPCRRRNDTGKIRKHAFEEGSEKLHARCRQYHSLQRLIDRVHAQWQGAPRGAATTRLAMRVRVLFLDSIYRVGTRATVSETREALYTALTSILRDQLHQGRIKSAVLAATDVLGTDTGGRAAAAPTSWEAYVGPGLLSVACNISIRDLRTQGMYRNFLEDSVNDADRDGRTNLRSLEPFVLNAWLRNAASELLQLTPETLLKICAPCEYVLVSRTYFARSDADRQS